MRLSLPALAVVSLGLVTSGLLAAEPVSAAPIATPTTRWLCHPRLADNPCELPLDTTYQRSDGTARVVTPPRTPVRQRRIDCFYVYPTVSNQLAVNASLAKDPELVSIAKYQAARFSQQCRLFAPVYRQATLAGLGLGALFGGDLPVGVGGGTGVRTAYADVKRAWATYLARDNHGRGFVLIGHSQGTMMLRKLIRDEIDMNPRVRRRLVGAILLGGNVTVAEGKATGGDFQNVPLCTRQGQIGCVVAYSTFHSDPPVAVVGNTDLDPLSPLMGLPHGKGYEVACTDPSTLSGSRQPLRLLLPSEPFAPGIIATLLDASTLGQLPSAGTTWVSPPTRAVGGCAWVDGAHIYRYQTAGPPQPPLHDAPALGTHLFDVNLGLEQLVSIVRQQERAYLKSRPGRQPSS